ncbi:MAG: hypothetical protein KAT48_09090, partial [Bacteroidales bacterium]|nr:hypothetical protein [Bacteroidales bacterium]
NPGLNLDVIATDISWIRAKSLTSYAGLIIDKGNLSDNGYMVYRTAGIDKWFAGLIGDDNFSISKTHSPTDGTFYISSAKNVGIGTTNTSAKLHVHGGYVSFYTTGGSNPTRARFSSLGSDALLYLYDQNDDIKVKIHSDGTTYFNGGDVGIGTTNPGYDLDVYDNYSSWIRAKSSTDYAGLIIDKGNASYNGYIMYKTVGAAQWYVGLIGDNNFSISKTWASSDGSFYIDQNSNVGIGSGDPVQHLEVYGSGNQYARITSSNHSIAGLELIRSGGSYYDWKIENKLNDLYFKFDANEFASTSTTAMYYDQSDHSLKFYKSDGTTVSIEIDADYGGDGRIITDELQITGGSDIAEPFDVISENEINPGMVVSIDKNFSGKLKISDLEYDRCVAGIISGAGNIKTGLFLQDKDTEADGEYPVALTGRVYCWADATHGAIEPGDLLTTSATPGHAMKVTDYGKAQGAILGKAMSGLEEGKGLVFVLVTLQ